MVLVMSKHNISKDALFWLNNNLKIFVFWLDVKKIVHGGVEDLLVQKILLIGGEI